jgi:hypothetical protein
LTKGALAYVAGTFLLPACPSPSGRARGDQGPPPRAVEASVTDASGDADAAAPPLPPPPLDSARWLSDHGIVHWEHDKTCWTSSLPPGAWSNACDCHEALTLATQPPVDLLVCKRSHETHEPNVSRVEHSVVYFADHGRLRAVLDLPTAATANLEHIPSPEATEAQNAEWLVGSKVRLGVGASGADLDVFDQTWGGAPADGGYACGAAAHAASEPPDVQRVYRSVCASIGEWRWNGASLVRLPASR